MEKDQGEVKYIQVAYDNISQLVDLVESYRDTINSVRDLYIANISLEMNDTMRTLTIFASILLPLTLVASIYGMNGLDLNSHCDNTFRFNYRLSHNGGNIMCDVLSIQQKEMDYFQKKKSPAKRCLQDIIYK